MKKRVLAAELSHETNRFSSVPTDLAAFEASGLELGEALLTSRVGTNSSFGGFITGAAQADFEIWPAMAVWATPSGMVTADAIDTLLKTLINQIERAEEVLGGLDGVLLGLHGAMVTERDPDGDGLILKTVRERVGANTPIVATLDLHANISPSMVEHADLLIGYDTYPHVDIAERAIEAARLLDRLMDDEIHPAVALVKPAMLPTSQRMTTDKDPMRRLIELAHEHESHPTVLNVTIAGGFPPADVAEAGLSVVVTTDNDPDRAEAIATEIASLAWKHRDEFLGGVSSFEDAADLLRAPAPDDDRPLVIVDIGDNPWTGGPGDSAELLRFLRDQAVSNAALALIADPEFVQVCHETGVGNSIEMDLGGKTDSLHGDPLPVTGTIRMLSDGRYRNSGPMMAGVQVDLGQSAVVAIGGVEVVVTSRAESPIDLNVFRRHGIEPSRKSVIGLKGKGHFRASFEPIAREIMLVEGPGITGADLSRLPFRYVERPIWPLDPIDDENNG